MSRIYRMKIPSFEEQNEYVNQAIIRQELTHGKYISILTQEFVARSGYKYVSFTTNGNTALIASIYALQLSGKKILVPSISTCFSMLNAIHACNSEPVFVDVDRNGNIDSAKAKNLDFDGILSPNHFGVKPNYKELKSFGVPIIEDSCQDIFNVLEGNNFGSVIVCSLYPTKILNGIDGGVILTNDELVNNRLFSTIQYEDQQIPSKALKFNFRFTNINAAFACGTISNIHKIKSRYDDLLEYYEEKLTGLEGMTILSPVIKNRTKILIQSNENVDINLSYGLLVSNGVGVSKELLALSELDKKSKASNLVNSTFSIPLYYDMTSEELSQVVKILRNE